MARALGIDISKYDSSQDGTRKMDFNKVKANSEEVVFIVARAGVSWGYEDPLFAYYWAEMARIGVCRMAYHVPHFGESALSQMDNLFKIVEGKANWSYDRLSLDLELEGINTKERVTATTLKCMDICRARTGRNPMLYSRANWVNAFLNVNILPQADWWLANYRTTLPYPLYTSEHPGPPYLPNGVSTYTVHQTGSRCKTIGGINYYMDYDRWNGDKADVLRYFGNPSIINPPPPPPTEVLFQAKCIVSALYKRSGPAVTYPVVGSLSMGDVVNVYEVKDNWFRIDPSSQVWCSGYGQYMQRVDENNPTVLFRAKCIVSALYKRSGPASTYSTVGYLVKDETVNVYAVTNNWFRLDPVAQVWCSGYPQYMQQL